jgi:hypothetical protein
MQRTKTATTIEKVNCEEPKERPPSRISTVCSVIIAKPTSSAAAAKEASLGVLRTSGAPSPGLRSADF